MAEQLDGIRAAYRELEHRTITALRRHLGDRPALDAVRSLALSLAAASEQHVNSIPPTEYAILQTSITAMVNDLDDAYHRSIDPPEGPPIVVVHRVRTGRRGQPRIHIDEDFLSRALELRGPTGIAPTIDVSSRTVRRRALEHNIVAPGAPVFQTQVLQSGETRRVHASTTTPVSNISDEELDVKVHAILQIFPTFGRRMIRGHLKSQGYRVPRSRITSSFVRVHGVSGIFGSRQIARKVYSVPGPMSLAHMDGQHGLIRYKMITHCIVDGFSRFVLGIRVHNNNRASSVLSLFNDVCHVHGVPSRMRGDHGVENVAVARRMEAIKGPGRGSFLWGRSVHNTRIERLWYDVTNGYGKKWSEFFMDLEVNHRLNHASAGHIWLLHHLFLTSVDRDAREWAEAWNSHNLQIRGERERSPWDMFFFGMLQEGPRGISSVVRDDDVVEADIYGVDWEVINDDDLMAHLLENNPQDRQGANPFSSASTPENLSEVLCEPPDCPFTPEQLAYLDGELRQRVDLFSRNMNVRRLVWQEGLAISKELYEMSLNV